jgi:hypothetical protein
MKQPQLEKKLIKVGLPKSVAHKMSLKLTSNVGEGLRGKYKKDEKWGDIDKRKSKKRKLSLRAKIAERKMRKTLKFRFK